VEESSLPHDQDMRSGSLLDIEIELDPTVSFAMQQNEVPVVKTLRVTNKGEAVSENLLVRVWSEPEFAVPWETHVASVTSGSTYSLDTVDLDLSPDYLA